MNVADRIQRLRKEKGMSQEELAEILGVSRQAVSKWESAQNIPDVDKIIALGDFFGVTTDYILKGVESESKGKSGWSRVLFVLGTALNYIGLIILLFDAISTWNIVPKYMPSEMVMRKAIIVICMIIGTVLFLISDKKITYAKVRIFLMINIFAYAGIGSLIVYLLHIPYLWEVIVYILIVIITEVILLKEEIIRLKEQMKDKINVLRH